MSDAKEIRAFGLVSGGLDSVLAVKVLQDQGVRVSAIAFETPFFGAHRARVAMAEIDVPLRVVDITDDHLAMLMAPPHGYGRNMNPCIDCHALMLQWAGRIMKEEGADFIFTGEVLGQRPMSQTASSLRLVSKLSGCDGYVLRPMSARLLPSTIPEDEGKVDRERLLDIQGRNRKRQMAMAEAYGLASFSSPAGGCLLTDPGFSARLRDLLASPRKSQVRDFELLKVGRHLRLTPHVKIIAGRNKAENERIESLAGPADVRITIRGIPGPLVLVPGGADEEVLKQAAAVCAAYSDASPGSDVEALLVSNGQSRVVSASAVERVTFRPMLIERQESAGKRERRPGPTPEETDSAVLSGRES